MDLSVRVNDVPDVDIGSVVRCCWCRKVQETCYRKHFGLVSGLDLDVEMSRL